MKKDCSAQPLTANTLLTGKNSWNERSFIIPFHSVPLTPTFPFEFDHISPIASLLLFPVLHWTVGNMERERRG